MKFIMNSKTLNNSMIWVLYILFLFAHLSSLVDFLICCFEEFKLLNLFYFIPLFFIHFDFHQFKILDLIKIYFNHLH